MKKYLTILAVTIPLAYCHPVPAEPIDLDKELECLTVALYHEARSASYDGLLSVATVIMNRVASSKYENTVCGVVYQPYQFSFVGHGKPETYNDIVAEAELKPNQYDLKSLEYCLDVAQTAYNKADVPFGEDVLYYHTDSIKPYWTTNLTMVDIVDDHVFWRL